MTPNNVDEPVTCIKFQAKDEKLGKFVDEVESFQR